MSRLQKKRLATLLHVAATEYKRLSEFYQVDFDKVREIAIQSRLAYIEGAYVEAYVTPQTCEFIREYLPKVLHDYWGLTPSDFAIYYYVTVPEKENKIQVVFHSL